ncbi:MAG TPA: DUF4862 family protein [Candidatus Sulfotelmatobacter sp.]|nr:DUF4862 family protein [Candidatus Sulfotelmatobacter sp.]
MNFFLGAYATSPCGSVWDEAAETAYWQGLKAIPHLRGLEYPFTGKLHPHDEAWALASLDPAWDMVLTCLPGTMDRLEADARFGLASDDEDGRRAAVDFIRQAVPVVSRLNDQAHRRRVVAVELHSAPRRGVTGVTASPASFARSLAEIAGWNWLGAKLVVEHCDAFRPDLPPIKGFLTFDEEIDAVRRSGAEIGLCVNWGRSALEARDAARPLEQIARARAEGLLAGVMFSGCSGEDTPWGVWQDSHMPHAPAAGFPYAAPGSMMTAEAVAQALAAAGDAPLFIGGKLTARPKDAALGVRLGLNRDLLGLMSASFVRR